MTTRPTPPSVHELATLGEHRYLSLRTFRRDGTAVDTPMWFAVRADHIVLRTPADASKAKRLRADPRVEGRPATVRGAPIGPTVLRGRATILDGEDAEEANRALHQRYGWQYNVVPMIPLPFVPRAKHDLSVVQRFRNMRSATLWSTSVIVRIDPVR